MPGVNDAKSVAELEPAAVWKFFGGIAATPRPSKREERIRKHIREVAQEHGLAVREDHVGNVVIDVPASPDREQAPITVLQAHLDMVCEKNTRTAHDFDVDPIRLIVDTHGENGELIVRADGTTLGADNGIGVALALAAATTPDVVHGPLELLFTFDEEVGMSGAKALGPTSFRGRRMLNLDSEDDETLYVGCAGGCDSVMTWEFNTGEPSADSDCFRIAVGGLRGGHSGADIHENRGNAIKLLVRTLSRLERGSLQLCSMSGGSVRNAIPREAEAVVLIPASQAAMLRSAAEQLRDEAAAELAEAALAIQVETVPHTDGTRTISPDDTSRLLSVLANLPNGVLGMHPRIEGLVETSNNVATVETTARADLTRVVVCTLSRSSSASRMSEALDQIGSVATGSGAEVATCNAYPAWEPKLDSPTLATCSRVYEQLFGKPPAVTAIHAGLECGIIGQEVGGMDMVSLGPRIEGAHSPDERVFVSSVQKCWNYLVAILAELSRES